VQSHYLIEKHSTMPNLPRVQSTFSSAIDAVGRACALPDGAFIAQRADLAKVLFRLGFLQLQDNGDCSFDKSQENAFPNSSTLRLMGARP
jgi:hypothetical protein